MQHAETGTQNSQAKWWAPTWLAALRVYFCVVPAGNLIWEALRLPLYTNLENRYPQRAGLRRVHCTVGAPLIAVRTLTLTLVKGATLRWPRALPSRPREVETTP